MKLDALGEYVVVKPVKKVNQKVHLPDSYMESMEEGILVSNGSKNADPKLKPGDKILYTTIGSVKFQEYLLVTQNSLVAVIRDE